MVWWTEYISKGSSNSTPPYISAYLSSVTRYWMTKIPDFKMQCSQISWCVMIMSIRETGRSRVCDSSAGGVSKSLIFVPWLSLVSVWGDVVFLSLMYIFHGDKMPKSARVGIFTFALSKHLGLTVFCDFLLVSGINHVPSKHELGQQSLGIRSSCYECG